MLSEVQSRLDSQLMICRRGTAGKSTGPVRGTEGATERFTVPVQTVNWYTAEPITVIMEPLAREYPASLSHYHLQRPRNRSRVADTAYTPAARRFPGSRTTRATFT